MEVPMNPIPAAVALLVKIFLEWWLEDSD